jgi:hypothetical protein
VLRRAGRLGCSTDAQSIPLLLSGHSPSSKPVTLRSSLKAGLYSPRGTHAPTRHHCSNRSNASSRDTQEYAVAAYGQKKWSQELFMLRLGRPLITNLDADFSRGRALLIIAFRFLATHPTPLRKTTGAPLMRLRPEGDRAPHYRRGRFSLG